jgi:hypothetical protein
MPVSSEVREGLHNAYVQCALVKLMPMPARRSMFGVRAWGWPPIHPIQSFKSSTMMNNTFGPSCLTARGRGGGGCTAGSPEAAGIAGVAGAGLFFFVALNAVAGTSIKVTAMKAMPARG